MGLPSFPFLLTVTHPPFSLKTHCMSIYVTLGDGYLPKVESDSLLVRLEIDCHKEKGKGVMLSVNPITLTTFNYVSIRLWVCSLLKLCQRLILLERTREEGKGNPIAKTARWRWLRSIKLMPLDFSQDLPRVFLSEPGGSSAEVLLHGGQVVSWKNKHGEELLFMSSKPIWKSCKAVRGGISTYFPQFGNLGSLFHRSPRNRLWSLDNCPLPVAPTSNRSSVDLIFKPAEEDMKMWPRSFELRLHISLGPGKLILIPRVRNTDHKPFAFTFSLCNYLSISDISEVRVEGLETLDYLDNLLHRKRFTEQADAITFDGEVDRVYLSTPTNVAVIDHEKKRTFVLYKEGLPDAVVWNPWDKMAKALPDLGDQDYKTMLYMCSAAVENPIVLKPMEEWKGCQELSAVSSSYCSGQLDPAKVLHVSN
ncbi:putative glucose-6-phosphate 1-epimerase isoform X2 [Actinidia eriantha]|uniref:putative glucose-6-phosphate 1-epimerase isoform X2 n=1 Tax=Actinidia eriantha TaxID=165200 RepID=UPI002590C725|nr:putative glucose-6-phosphate 1-epimerase isoform X2 [Actinidia eriantha]